MKKAKWLEMSYQQVDGGEIDTLYKRFENGNTRIVQFNEEEKADEIGVIYLTKEQTEKLFQ